MITLEQAIEIAESSLGAIDSISDCGDRWAFDFVSERNKFGAISLFVFKDSGNTEFFSYSMQEYQEMLKAAKLLKEFQ